MNIEIQYRPANSVAFLKFEGGETCTAEAGSMIAMSSGLDLETTTHKKKQGNLFRAVKRVLAGESFFLNHYTASRPAELWLAPGQSGDILKVDLQQSKIIVQSGGFLASAKDINIDLGWQGFKSLFSGESLFWLSLSGDGFVLLSSFGCIYEVFVDGDYTVDTSHIVAFDESLDFKISKAGTSWMHSFLGGEGLTCRFRGRGRLWCQSHTQKSLGQALASSLRPRNR